MDEKDRELQQYDAVYVTAKEEALERDRDLSELRIALDEARRKASFATEKEKELEQRISEQSREAACEREQVQRNTGIELNVLRDRHTSEKHALERQLLDANERLAGLRAELAAEFDGARAKITADLREKVGEAEGREMGEASRANQLANKVDVLAKRCDGLELELKTTREQVSGLHVSSELLGGTVCACVSSRPLSTWC